EGHILLALKLQHVAGLDLNRGVDLRILHHHSLPTDRPGTLQQGVEVPRSVGHRATHHPTIGKLGWIDHVQAPGAREERHRTGSHAALRDHIFIVSGFTDQA
ncbi:MAG: hypothetical protein ACK559_42465, partial [bacterium]